MPAWVFSIWSMKWFGAICFFALSWKSECSYGLLQSQPTLLFVFFILSGTEFGISPFDYWAQIFPGEFHLCFCNLQRFSLEIFGKLRVLSPTDQPVQTSSVIPTINSGNIFKMKKIHWLINLMWFKPYLYIYCNTILMIWKVFCHIYMLPRTEIKFNVNQILATRYID